MALSTLSLSLALALTLTLLLSPGCAGAPAASRVEGQPQQQPHSHVHPLATVPRPLGYHPLHDQADVGASLTVTPAVLTAAQSEVNISWTNFRFSQSYDWIGMYCGDQKPLQNAPIKYQLVGVSPTYRDGYGWVKFSLTNMRAQCSFCLVNGGAQFPLVLATSNNVTFADLDEPGGIHLALVKEVAAASTAMRVSWSSASKAAMTVVYGEDAKSLTNKVVSTVDTYTVADMSAQPASGSGWYDPGALHTAVLEVDAGKPYYYAVQYGAGKQTATRHFTVPAPVAAADEGASTYVLAFGDMGNAGKDGSRQHSWDYSNHGEINARNTTDRLTEELANDPSLVLHIGDISYAVGFLSEWDQFMEQVEPVAGYVPWMTAIGNHEQGDPTSYMAGTDSGGENGVAYARRFRNVAPADAGDPSLGYYAFEHGLFHFVVMSTEHDFTEGSAQHTYLDAALGRVDRDRTPWLVFCGHRPMYVDSTYGGNPTSDVVVAQSLQDHVEPLLSKYKADLALWGHHHSYQRTGLVLNGKRAANGIPHLVIGMAGYSLTSLPDQDLPFVDKALSFDWGYTRLNASKTELVVQFVINSNATVQDELRLTH